MFKTYMRLLGFVSPISKYAVPYFFYALLYALFNTLTYAMILPIMNTLFDDKNSYVFQPVLRLSRARALVLGYRRLADVELRLYATVRDGFSRCRKCFSCSPAVRS